MRGVGNTLVIKVSIVRISASMDNDMPSYLYTAHCQLYLDIQASY